MCKWIIVCEGVILIIELGVVIKGGVGIGVDVISLVVVWGVGIMVEGMLELFIVFIFILDEIIFEDIVVGNFGSLNFNLEDVLFWGGVLVFGWVLIFVSNDNG